MQTPYDFASKVDRMVYVKPVSVAELPEEVQTQADGLEQIYSVHDAEGTQLALVANRKLAFKLAREHDYAPQPLH
ncbi:MAG: DUF1150 family protein [Rhodobacteraceae bacterium]|nr:DUF1150 family protein [Paracoccaceae bacterium]